DAAGGAGLVVGVASEQGQGLISRLEPGCRRGVERQAAEGGCTVLFYRSAARVLRPGFTPEPRPGRVGVLTAGTADLPAADEARMVVESAGLEARIEADVGVAGLHRLIGPLTETLAWAPDVLVVAAGMD